MIKYAITGNIASGKTQAEQIIKDMGYKVFDADIIAHKILESSTEVLEVFKDYDIVECGKISRKKLGNLVFNNSQLRQQLEDIIHPLVANEIKKKFEQYKSEKYIFVSIPLLFETNMQTLFDKIIFIYCDDNLRLERLMKRNNLTKDEAFARMNSQISQDKKINLSDYIIKNESTIEKLKQQIHNIL